MHRYHLKPGEVDTFLQAKLPETFEQKNIFAEKGSKILLPLSGSASQSTEAKEVLKCLNSPFLNK